MLSTNGRLIPYVPVLELLRGYFGIEPRDGDREARRKIAGTLLLLDRELEAALPLLFDFLGVPDPERPAPSRDAGTQRQLHGVFRRLVQAESRRQPGVVLIEDLHWIDAESDLVLAQLVEATLASRGLLLLSFRPEYRAAWMERVGYQHVSLLPLGSEALDALLADLLGSDPSVAGLAATIRSRTGGNPFFVEEVVRELAESGVLAGERALIA